jgi:hypothetical protein
MRASPQTKKARRNNPAGLTNHPKIDQEKIFSKSSTTNCSLI